MTIAASGAVVAILARPERAAKPVAAAPIARDAETLESRTLVVAGTAQLAPTLIAAGVSATDATAAWVRSAIGYRAAATYA